MSSHEKEMQRENEREAWVVFKQAVKECQSLQFDPKQLTGYIDMQYINIKGGIKGK